MAMRWRTSAPHLDHDWAPPDRIDDQGPRGRSMQQPMTDSRSARRASGSLHPRTDGVRPRKLPVRVYASTQTHSETSASGTLSEGTLEAPAGNQKTDERLATNSRTSSEQVDPQRCTRQGLTLKKGRPWQKT